MPENASIILASSSAIRKRLLTEAGVEFVTVPADIDEAAIRAENDNLSFDSAASKLARAKALSISEQYPDALVIGSDQIAALDNEVLTKPGTPENAKAQLQRLAGKHHMQYSAASICKGGVERWRYVDMAHLTMKPLTEAEIDSYVATDNPVDACGAYYYEKNGHTLFSNVHGAKETVLGLPLSPLLIALREYGL